jgi:hypothetical protein
VSYYTHLTGEIMIDPPLAWAEVKGDQGRGHTNVSPYPNNPGRNALQIILDKYLQETDEGVLTVMQGIAIGGPDEDPRGDTTDITARDELQEILDRYAVDGRTFDGLIKGRGEAPLDVWRLRAEQDGERWVAVVDTLTISWGDE